MTRLIPITFKKSVGQPRDIEGKFFRISSRTIFQRAQILLGKTTIYRPKAFLLEILKLSKYSKLHVDGLGKRFLDRILPSHEISPNGVPETLDEISQVLGDEIGLLELRYPRSGMKVDFELVVLGNVKNRASLNAIRHNLEQREY
jgi:hypothetical protein